VADLRQRGRAAIGEAAAEREWDAGTRLNAADATALAQGSAVRAGASASPLSARETEVSRLVATGMSNAEIADRLRLSRRTVENHVLHILNKLGAANRTQIAGWVIRKD